MSEPSNEAKNEKQMNEQKMLEQAKALNKALKELEEVMEIRQPWEGNFGDFMRDPSKRLQF